MIRLAFDFFDCECILARGSRNCGDVWLLIIVGNFASIGALSRGRWTRQSWTKKWDLAQVSLCCAISSEVQKVLWTTISNQYFQIVYMSNWIYLIHWVRYWTLCSNLNDHFSNSIYCQLREVYHLFYEYPFYLFALYQWNQWSLFSRPKTYSVDHFTFFVRCYLFLFGDQCFYCLKYGLFSYLTFFEWSCFLA